ncbi:MAG: ATP-binding protein [Kiritimatiellae bacterium]|nr:ATP-binding protein [Kiritimatiellia bacterium]
MEKFFNVAGPCIPAKHYMLPALDRLPAIRRLVDREQYFVVHAPRQTGKTTAIQALVDEINAKGDMVALYCTLETLQSATDPVRAAMAIASLLRSNAENALPRVFRPAAPKGRVRETAAQYAAESLAVCDALRELCRRAGKPLVVFFDEADCLFGNVLVSFLRQLRDGYVNRARIPFPSSIALVGMLDVRDYKAQIRPDGESLGQISPFNIISEDMMLRNFTADEVRTLYAQHTEATGQQFAPDALDAVMDWTDGQPWLVNAIARECVEKIHDFSYGEPITAADIETAKETIIRRRDTHVDSLMERLREPRVRRVVEPVIFGGERTVSSNSEDWRFVVDLGLLREENGTLVPANKMYAEIVGRYLSRDEQESMMQSIPQTPWATVDGLDMPGLMAAFQAFWRENSGADRRAYEYGEATPHLVLMAFLQRVTNGSGRIIREMALGSGRLDLCVEFRDKRYAVEVKTSKNFAGEKSCAQLAGYLDKLGLPEGWMAIFDEDKAKPWEDKLFTRDVELNGKKLHLIGL